MTDIDKAARDARAHFLRWIEWYKKAAAGPDEEEISQEELARRTAGGITASAISQWKTKPSRYPNLRSIFILHAVISAIVDVDMDHLLTRNPPPLARR